MALEPLETRQATDIATDRKLYLGEPVSDNVKGAASSQRRRAQTGTCLHGGSWRSRSKRTCISSSQSATV